MATRPTVTEVAVVSLAAVLPHAPPMILLDHVVETGLGFIRCAVEIREDSLFHNGNTGVPGWIALEYMAQAVAAFNGIQACERKGSPRRGLLVGARKVKIATPVLTTGRHLIVTATLADHSADLYQFDCDVSDRDDGKTQVTATLNLALTEVPK